MIHLHQAIYILNPSIKVIRGEEAFDENDNPIDYDLDAAQAKLAEMQTEAENAKQAEINAKQTALNKLSALGLTENEVKALLG
jgi:hypothetical protein